MAVSGRKISDYESSLSNGSAEDFEHMCVPCLSDGQHIQAQWFCVDCQEYLCDTCRHCHKTTKASKYHQVINIDTHDQHVSTSKTSEVCAEICSTHKNEVIKFFCPKHNELGCHDCMTLTHRTCNPDYIPDKCVGISDSGEYQDILKNLNLKLNEAETFMKRAEDKNKEIDAWYDDAIKDVENIREEINDHLDTIERNIKEEAKRRRSTDKQEIKTIQESYTNFISDIRMLKSSLKDLKEKNKNSDVFIAVKRAKSKLQSDVIRCENVFDKNTKLLLECNEALENILSMECFGKLTKYTTNVTTNPNMQTSPTTPSTPPTGKKQFSSLSHKSDIDIKTKADSETCGIRGCAVLSSDKLILADLHNNKLKVVNRTTKAVVEEFQLDAYPFDVTVMSEDQIAVTIPDKKEIMILRTTGQLSPSRSIKVQEECRGITYYHDRLYVVCQDPHCVRILDLKGKVKDTIPLKDKTVFSCPRYIEVSRENKLPYISDYVMNSVISVTLKGEISAVNRDISEPAGLVMLDDGSLLVCSCNTSSIYSLQAGRKQSCKIVSGLNKLWSICCSPEKSEVYVGGVGDHLKVIRLK